MKKKCSKCGRMLDHSEFYGKEKHSNRLHSWCKECISKYYEERNKSLKREAMVAFGSQCVHIDKNNIQCPKNVKDNLRELELSHPNGDGDEHRALIGGGKGGYKFYEALKKLGYNPGKFVVWVMCRAHHTRLDKSGKKHSQYKEGKFNDSGWLEKEYETKSMRKIAKENGVGYGLIRRRIIEFNISRRKPGRRVK